MRRSRAQLARITKSSRRYSTPSTYREITVLEDGSIDVFRRKAFQPAVPAVLPHGHFSQLPAVTSWFTQQDAGSGVQTLNHGYLRPYGETIVPLELTGHTSASPSNSTNDAFQRFQAPLSLFLTWTRTANSESPNRLYLAQAQVTDLPRQLRDDLPVPDLVMKTGKGDIYDTNLWIGLAPTYTPLHRDPNPNLFVQLAGTKVVRLIEPAAGAVIFARVQGKMGRVGPAAFRGEEMMQGQEKRLLDTEVWGDPGSGSEGIERGYEARLERGDGLFIPKGWWHSIKGVGEGITGSVNWWFR
ncbi:hypothetical protein MMC16_006375 [Acarospora aff. strigata]|nr:hypothetical protein [Acarospora aff. strigata]